MSSAMSRLCESTDEAYCFMVNPWASYRLWVLSTKDTYL